MKIYLEALEAARQYGGPAKPAQGPRACDEAAHPSSGEDTYAVFHPGNACVRITQAFNTVVIETEDGARYGVALRDSGLEVVCPDKTLVGIKRYDGVTLGNETFIERNGEVLG